MTDLLMIDVSHHQGVINWERVRASGVRAAMIKAGSGAGGIDEMFARNIKACNELGIPCGVYWFSYASSTLMACREAKYAIAAVRPYTLQLPIAFDWEYVSYARAVADGVTPTPEITASLAANFCATVKSTGYTPMIYTNLDYMQRFFRPEICPGVDRWIASYSRQPSVPCAAWQYSESGRVPGITAPVDLNHLYKDYEEDDSMRYKYLRDVPKEYYPYVRSMMEEGSISGRASAATLDDTEIDLSEDQIRTMIFILRHEEKSKIK